jgi:GNAT superfamily N-acetyltransferase
VKTVTLRGIADPQDAALRELSRLLYAVFADPDVVLDLERMRDFLSHNDASADRHFCVLVAEEDAALLGGTVFSYVPASNCGFSEYLVVRKDRHGQGLGRQLVDARRAELDDLARQAGQAACRGVFIEADNPQRTPAALQLQERETAMDTVARLRVFAHLGFRRVDMAYIQPSLGSGKQPVPYLDLLFAPWDEVVGEAERVPAEWVYRTVGPIWDSWAPDSLRSHWCILREQLGDTSLALAPLLE